MLPVLKSINDFFSNLQEVYLPAAKQKKINCTIQTLQFSCITRRFRNILMKTASVTHGSKVCALNFARFFHEKHRFAIGNRLHTLCCTHAPAVCGTV